MQPPKDKEGTDAPAPDAAGPERGSYLPDDDQVVENIPFKSPKSGRIFTIKRTKERDQYIKKKRSDDSGSKSGADD